MVELIDWAGRGATICGLVGLVLSLALRQLGYMRVVQVPVPPYGHQLVAVPIDVLTWTGYLALVGTVAGGLFGLTQV